MATILIVDDDLATRNYLRDLLSQAGHLCPEAANGAEALERVRAERPDVVITDVLMPVMDGYELVRQLRAQPAVARTPVVFFSGVYREAEVRALAETCGVLRL